MAEALEATSLDKRQREHLDVCTTAGRHLLEMVSNVLDLAKAESGSMPELIEPFSIRDVIEELEYVWSHVARKKGLRFQTHLDNALPQVLRGDRSRLRVVLTNFISNAIKFTDQGQISVALERLPASAEQSKVGLMFTIANTGVGIEEQDTDLIFPAFVRTRRTDLNTPS
ncbi:MAG: signal transduction histidine kinase [Planctomycetota bacterium]|jgi:signal transduction histidine kinase